MDAKALKNEFEALKQRRSNWDRMYQVLGKYVSLIKQNFEQTQSPGEFLVNEIYDATGAFAAQNAASALLGMLWPGTAKQAVEIMPPKGMKLTTVLTNFYADMTRRVISAMDDPKANLALAFDEYMLDQVIFGTSGIGVEKGYKSKLLFKPYGVKEAYIDEGRDGTVHKIFLLFEWSLERVIDEYKLENLSKKLQDMAKNGKTGNMIKILICIVPRKEKDKRAEEGVYSMPYASIHMEYDDNHKLKESGFEEMPIMFGRFRKLMYERYGRSPAMNALPDIREANALREAVIVATEKILNMPKGVFSDSLFGGGVIDMSAGAVNVFNSTNAMANQPPIFDMGAPPNLPWAEKRLEKLEETISRHFSIDRLLDFNNDQEMTFGEAQIRNQIRNQSLSSLFTRQISEVLTPLIERSVSILWREGEFGVIKGSQEEQELIDAGVADIRYVPDEIADLLEKGEDIYSIVYKTQASNASRAEEYLGIIDVTNFTVQAMAVDPSLKHRLNLHEATKIISSIRGIPVNVIREDDAVEKLQQEEQQQMQLAQGMMLASEGAGAAKDLAQAKKAGAEAENAAL